MHADRGIYVPLACNSKIWLISLFFAIPYVAVIAASVFPSAFSISVWSGVKPTRASTARNTKSEGREQPSRAGGHPKINLNAGCASLRCSRQPPCALHQATQSPHCCLIPAPVPVPRRNAIGFEHGSDLQPLSSDSAGWVLLLPQLRAAATRLFSGELCRCRPG